MSSNERLDLIAEKVNQLRQELAALGFETSFFFRAPAVSYTHLEPTRR